MRDGSARVGGEMSMLFRLLAGVEDDDGNYGDYGGYGDYGAYVYWLRGDARGVKPRGK